MICSYGTDCDTGAGWLDGMCLAHWERAHTAEVPELLAEAVESMTTWQKVPHHNGYVDVTVNTGASWGDARLRMTWGYVPATPPEYIPVAQYRPLRPPKPDPPKPPPPREPGLFPRLWATWKYHRRQLQPWRRSWWVVEPERRAPWWAWTTGAGGVVMLGLELAPRLGWAW